MKASLEVRIAHRPERFPLIYKTDDEVKAEKDSVLRKFRALLPHEP